jgi:hypothetical protein
VSDKNALTAVLRAVRAALSDGPLERIEVRHVHADGNEARMGAFAGDKISGKGVTAESIADEILEDIEEDVRLFDGVQNYVVLFYKPGERDYVRRKQVQVKGKSEKTTDAIERSEPPTEKGVTSMSMRHLETRAADVTQRERIVAQQNEMLITRLSSMVERLADVFPRVLGAEQALIDRTEERKLEIRRAEKQDKLVERGVEQLMMYGGPLLRKLLPGPTGAAIGDDAMLINLLASMTPDQIQAFMQTLRPEQQANFVELYKSLRERYEKVKLSNEEKPEATKQGEST